MKVLVIGGTSGLGKASALRLRADGHAVLVASRKSVPVEDIGHVSLDISSPDSVTAGLATAERRLGGLDAIVASAGVIADERLLETGLDEWRQMMRVNVLGLANLLEAAPAHFGAAGGIGVVLSSDAGLWPEAGAGAYSVSKHMVTAMTRGLAVGWGLAGHRLNMVCPGDIAPGMRTGIGGQRSADLSTWPTPPAGRIGQAEDVAGAVAWLLSDDASFLCGEALLVDGGGQATIDAMGRRGGDGND